MDSYTSLVYKTIERYLEKRQIIETPSDLPEKMLKNQAGAFVSLHKTNNELRGCIGTFSPTQENIAQEIIHNAISAAFHDPRFMPLQKNELNDLKISVDILSKPESIKSIKKLDEKKYGIIVKAENGRSGLLLPDIEGVGSIDEQILITCQKAGINPLKEKFSVFRFTVERHK